MGTTDSARRYSKELRLQYCMEHLVLRTAPELWLRVYELWGDLDQDAPRYGRLYGGMYNQFVVNKNLLLDDHEDDGNHPQVSLPSFTFEPFAVCLTLCGAWCPRRV